jgi:hypothetical protein
MVKITIYAENADNLAQDLKETGDQAVSQQLSAIRFNAVREGWGAES